MNLLSTARLGSRMATSSASFDLSVSAARSGPTGVPTSSSRWHTAHVFFEDGGLAGRLVARRPRDLPGAASGHTRDIVDGGLPIRAAVEAVSSLPARPRISSSRWSSSRCRRAASISPAARRPGLDLRRAVASSQASRRSSTSSTLPRRSGPGLFQAAEQHRGPLSASSSPRERRDHGPLQRRRRTRAQATPPTAARSSFCRSGPRPTSATAAIRFRFCGLSARRPVCAGQANMGCSGRWQPRPCLARRRPLCETWPARDFCGRAYRAGRPAP